MKTPAPPPVDHAQRAATAADRPVAEAAKEILEIRLERVDAMITGICRFGVDQEPWVHQLRVATRRAQAALRWFAPTLSRRRRRSVRKALRRLRLAADAARNLDVLARDLSRNAPFEAELTTDYARQIESQRDDARRPLEEVLERYGHDVWRRKMRRVLKSVHWRSPDEPEPSYEQHTRQQWKEARKRFEAALALPQKQAADQHRLRIAVKKLRYAAEIARPLFEDEIPARLLDELSSLQEDLGAVNDHATALEWLQTRLHVDLDDPKRRWRAWVEHHRHELEQHAAHFQFAWPAARLQDLTRW
jgi:CHAD domain-containing protein